MKYFLLLSYINEKPIGAHSINLWSIDSRWLLEKYKDKLYFADQDILNALFGISPW